VISSPPEFQDPRKPAVRYIPVPMARSIKPLSDLKSIWDLYRIFKEEKFDVVHSHTAKAGFITAVAAKLAKVPVICHTYHGLPFFEGQNKKSHLIYRFLEKLVCKFRNYIFTQNKRDLPECVKLINSEEKALFEGNGVDVEYLIESAQRQLSEANKDYSGQGLRLLVLSRFEPVKRVSDFIKVANKLNQENIKVSCVIAGCGGYLEQELKDQVKDLGLTKCINMVGYSTQPHGLIQACDIILLCSEKEGIPRSLMEAMALKKPVIATDVTGTQELVLDGETGFLAPLGDINKISEKVKLLADNASLREKMGMAGKKRILSNYNDVKIAKFLHDYYIRAIEQIRCSGNVSRDSDKMTKALS